jgi:hypothetical protein
MLQNTASFSFSPCGFLLRTVALLVAVAVGPIPMADAEPLLPSVLEFHASATKLNLHGKGFTGTIPSEIGLLTLLASGLDLSQNSFTGPIPSQLGYQSL